ncbi:DEAD/DEAH box helicase [Pseudomonas sp. KB_12]|uniref:DEAD/DEAH box helicase n=1 Tax=Pseudomonas sp. KB_12 TaxID=3233034 RepID=UPI003F948101
MDLSDEDFYIPLTKLYRGSILKLFAITKEAGDILSDNECNRLIGLASALSISEESDKINLSYEIITRLLENYSDKLPKINGAADLIFSRIGNFPGRSLLRSRYTNGASPDIPFTLSLERLARETENSVSNDTLLTNFQYKLFTSLTAERSLSVSAPTSAGKSFVLNMDLLRRLSSQTDKCIVYIVPTRALISEVTSRIRSTVRHQGLSDVIIRSAPFPLESHLKSKSVVYVLTQERLLSLLKPENDVTRIDSVFVDEAHEIHKGKRGIVLQNAVDLTLKKYPSASIFFASPLIKNPGYFLHLFNRMDNGYFFTEQISPVSQNIILVSQITRQPKFANFKLHTRFGIIDVGNYDLGISFRPPIFQRRSAFAKLITKQNESTIIFSNGPAEAEDLARFLAKSLAEQDISEDVKDFISFIKTEIHEEHPLVLTLPKGVAFHYGDLPSIVRSGVESLFKSGEIKYICSTSTLLQGVNLPAKHIVIENPKSGTTPMHRPDFLNLAGRAGRLLKEFHGNVWCLTPESWEEPSYTGDGLQEIQSSMSKIMADGGTLIQSLMTGKVEGENQKELAEAGLGRLFHESQQSTIDEITQKYESDLNSEYLAQTLEIIESLDISLPAHILDTHRVLRPDHLQNLYNRFMEEIDTNQLTLISPYETGGKARMEKAIELICEAFDWKLTEMQRLWYGGLAHKWVTGTPISQLIRDRVIRLRKEDPMAKASPIIRNILSVIEKKVRFSLVKYFSAYEDILRQAMIDRHQIAKNIKIAPYHTFLEFGSCDKVNLSLMALGFSRFTALRLKNKLNWADSSEPEDYLEILMRYDISKLGIPKMCQYEIEDILGLK